MSKDYCKMCFDAAVCPDLNDDNDYSAHCIDICSEKNIRLMMCAGWGRSPRLEVDVLNNNIWCTVLNFYPNFCPNCGRKIDKTKYSIKKD